MRCLRKYVTLSRHDRRLLMQAAFVLMGVWGGLSLVPFQILYRLVTRMPPKKTSCPTDRAADIAPVIWAIDVASHYVPKATCLIRALALQVLLRRQGKTSRLCIGVAKGSAGTLEAHAWVEYQGCIVLGDCAGLSRYTPLPLPEKPSVAG